MSSLIRRQEGIALPTTMLTLMVITILTGVIAATAIQASGTSNQNRSSARALAAANAGLKAAEFRLSVIGAQNANCFTTQEFAPTGGICALGASESIGNGESYQYVVGPVLSQSGSCAGLWVQSAGSQPVEQRCIVSIGTANGVSRRVQERIVAYQPSSSGGGSGGGTYGGNAQFPFAGIWSFGDVKASGSFSLTGILGADGNVTLPANAVVSNPAWFFLPAGPYYYGTLSGCTSGQCSPIHLFAQLFMFGSPAAPFQFLSDSWYASSQQTATTVDAQINWPSSVTWDATHRTLTATQPVGSASNPVQLPSGRYNFCNLNFSSDAYFSIAPGAHVIIDVDSPYRTGGTPATNCQAGTGNFIIGGNMHVMNWDPTALQINVHGDPQVWNPPSGHNSTVTINSDPASGPFVALVDARNSDFTSGNLNIVGALIVKSFTASSVNMTGTVVAPPSAVTPFYPAGWKECPATPSGSDPNSGC